MVGILFIICCIIYIVTTVILCYLDNKGKDYHWISFAVNILGFYGAVVFGFIMVIMWLSTLIINTIK